MAVDRRVGALEAAAAVTPAAGGAPDPAARAAAEALAERLAAAERAVAEVRAAQGAPPAAQTAATEALARQVAALQARLDVAERAARTADPTTARAAIVVSATQLRERMREAAPFTAELAAFRAAAGPISDAALAAALDRVAPFAERGAATVDDLARRFTPAADAALLAAEGEPEGWTDALLRGMRGLVRVRRTGGEGVDDDASRVARARALLAANDLPAALRALNGMSPALQAGLSPWIDDALARVAVDAAAADIGARAGALVAGPTPAGTPAAP